MLDVAVGSEICTTQHGFPLPQSTEETKAKKALTSINFRICFLYSTTFKVRKLGISSSIKNNYLLGGKMVEKNYNKQKQWMTLQKTKEVMATKLSNCTEKMTNSDGFQVHLNDGKMVQNAEKKMVNGSFFSLFSQVLNRVSLRLPTSL